MCFYELNKLQCIQNTAACLVERSARNEHIIPIRHCLYWLPIKDHIEFKPMLLTYKSQHDLASTGISELITSYNTHPRCLRSSSQCLLQAPHTQYWGQCCSHLMKQSSGLLLFTKLLRSLPSRVVWKLASVFKRNDTFFVLLIIVLAEHSCVVFMARCWGSWPRV